METSEILKKVRQIEIKTRGLSNNIFAGQYHSAFKGRGMSFSEVREYQFGDDIRDIDWNVTARFMGAQGAAGPDMNAQAGSNAGSNADDDVIDGDFREV